MKWALNLARYSPSSECECYYCYCSNCCCLKRRTDRNIIQIASLSKLFYRLPPRKLLKLDVLLLLLSGGFGFAIGYLQNSWPRSANEDSCCLFLASRIALGSVNWTGNSSLFRSNKETNQWWRRIVLQVKSRRWDDSCDAREKEFFKRSINSAINPFRDSNRIVLMTVIERVDRLQKSRPLITKEKSVEARKK